MCTRSLCINRDIECTSLRIQEKSSFDRMTLKWTTKMPKTFFFLVAGMSCHCKKATGWENWKKKVVKSDSIPFVICNENVYDYYGKRFQFFRPPTNKNQVNGIYSSFAKVMIEAEKNVRPKLYRRRITFQNETKEKWKENKKKRIVHFTFTNCFAINSTNNLYVLVIREALMHLLWSSFVRFFLSEEHFGKKCKKIPKFELKLKLKRV